MIMTCFMCKGNLENKNTTFMVEISEQIFIIKNVPSQVCNQCGETSYDAPTAKKIEQIIQGMSKSVSEISVVQYDKVVA